MADDQRKAGLVGEPLEFALPQPAAGAVAAAAVGGDDQAVGGAVARFSDIVPPTADRGDGEGGRGTRTGTGWVLAGRHLRIHNPSALAGGASPEVSPHR